jgi:hypothetical protein
MRTIGRTCQGGLRFRRCLLALWRKRRIDPICAGVAAGVNQEFAALLRASVRSRRCGDARTARTPLHGVQVALATVLHAGRRMQCRQVLISIASLSFGRQVIIDSRIIEGVCLRVWKRHWTAEPLAQQCQKKWCGRSLAVRC